ncbi:MAG: hypothetical protein ACE5OZ_20570 [Candidatus Heimdallarchaeota archaeon]
MVTKPLVVERMALEPIFGSDDDRSGFVVKGTRGDTVNFLISGIKRINITFGGHIHGRVRILWLRPGGMEIREEVLATTVVSAKRSVALMVSFDNMTSVILQGEPAVEDKTFQGQMIQASWSSEMVKVLPQSAKHLFFCTPNQRTRQIEVDIRKEHGRY